MVAGLLHLGAEREVVLDDAVVDDDDIAGAVEMRVRVVVGGLAVGGPAGVADAAAAMGIRAFEAGAERAELAGALGDTDLLAIERGDAGAVVSAVFEALEAIEEDRRGIALTGVADDASHQRTSGRRCPGFGVSCPVMQTPSRSRHARTGRAHVRVPSESARRDRTLDGLCRELAPRVLPRP